MVTLNEIYMSSPESCNPKCNDRNCPHAYKEWQGKWYITSGHAGFESKTNNVNGYAKEARAKHAYQYYFDKENGS